MRAVPVCPVLIALLACASAEAQDQNLPGDIDVAMSAADQSRLGVTTVRLESTDIADTVEGTARVLDIGGLASLDAEISSASAAAEASASDAKRMGLLVADDLNTSRQSFESARARAQSDAAALRFASQRVALEWGPGIAKLGDTGRHELVEQITSGTAALLRVDPLFPGSIAAGAVRLETTAKDARVESEVLGLAANADARLQTAGLLVVLRGESASTLRPGRVVAAEIETGEPLSGVILPRESLIRAEGRTWAYLRRDAGRFVRREILDAKIVSDGWFVSSHFAAGDNLVTAGAESLYGVERSDEAAEAE